MEIFPAIDEEQRRFIRSVIDDSDYYLLIVGGRYGSLTDEGVSYTEDEFDYAIQKGVPVVAFINNAVDQLPARDVEGTEVGRRRLARFVEKVKQGRLVRFWSSPEELAGLVATSLPKTIKMYPSRGWVRTPEYDFDELLERHRKLREDFDLLKSKNDKSCSLRVGVAPEPLPDSALDDFVVGQLDYEVTRQEEVGEVLLARGSCRPRLSELLCELGPSLVEPKMAEEVAGLVSTWITCRNSFEVSPGQASVSVFAALRILNVMRAASLVTTVEGGEVTSSYFSAPNSVLWQLSPYGDKKMLSLFYSPRTKSD